LLVSTSEYKLLEGLKRADKKAIGDLFEKYSLVLFAVIRSNTDDVQLTKIFCKILLFTVSEI
jgi:hypothetical protein